MRLKTVARIVGFLCMVFSMTMALPILVSLWYRDGETGHFSVSLIAMLFLGLVLWLPSLGRQAELRRRDGFFVVVLFWLILSLLGASPFVFGLHLSFVDALFESASGLSTTGATVISGLDALPPSILFYRQELQWFGGMGLIVLAVAVLPILGIGGMSVYRAEAPGPMKEEKLTPRLAHSARALWALYVGLTLACALAFWWVGMPPFEALAHSLSTISTGGFSTHDDSLGYFASVGVDTVATVFMLLGGINFSVHYLVWRDRSPWHYVRDPEVRGFILFVALVVVSVALVLRMTGRYGDLMAALGYASFEVVSVVTSTGFGVADFSVWPLFLPALMMYISFVGGCGGSTAGGMKVMRIQVLAKLGLREIRQLMHPRGIFPIRVGSHVLREQTLEAIWGFFSVYVLTFAVLMLLMMWTGLDQVSAFSAVATCMNNLGPGLGQVALTFAHVSDPGKLVAVAAMLLGRLEVLSILVMLHPAFWRS